MSRQNGQIGLNERLQNAKSAAEVVVLVREGNLHSRASEKTLRKRERIADRKLKAFRI